MTIYEGWLRSEGQIHNGINYDKLIEEIGSIFTNLVFSYSKRWGDSGQPTLQSLKGESPNASFFKTKLIISEFPSHPKKMGKIFIDLRKPFDNQENIDKIINILRKLLNISTNTPESSSPSPEESSTIESSNPVPELSTSTTESPTPTPELPNPVPEESSTPESPSSN